MQDELRALAARFRAAIEQAPPAEAAAPDPAPPPASSPGEIDLVITPKVKCDLLAYAGLHCGGQLSVVRVLPRGEADGAIDGAAFQSLMLAGPLGTRIVLATATGDDWQEYPWRAIVLTRGHTFTARNGKPAVRIPDLETVDRPDARRAADDARVSFDTAPSLEEGTGWTYGRPGPLRNRVRRIFVDKV